MSEQHSRKTSRSTRRRPKFARLLELAENPIAIVNDDFEVVDVNSACCQWVGVPAEDILGAKLRYSAAPSEETRGQPQHLLSGLCPDPELFGQTAKTQPGAGTSGFIWASNKDGKVWRRATFNRFVAPGESTVSILVVGEATDLTTPPSAANPPDSDRQRLHHLLSLQAEIDRGHFRLAQLAGTSSQAKRMRRQAAAAAGNLADCLIVGPPGSGREFLARTIFWERNVENATLMPIHCSIADSQSIQNSIKSWVFEQRERRSESWLLLLDVDRLDAAGQLELLGYTQIPNFRMRILATASIDLLPFAESGKYSLELARYLNVQTIELVPLSARLEDIPLLAQQFIENRNAADDAAGKQISGVSDELAEALCEHSWPHDTDELKRMIHAAYDKCGKSRIQLTDMPDEFHHGLAAARIGGREVVEINLEVYLADIEKELIARAIKQSGNNRAQAARLLGISRARLLRRIESLGLAESTAKPEMFETAADDEIDESAFKEAE